VTQIERNSQYGPQVIVALDFSSAHDALSLVTRLDPRLCRLKVGKELFTREGPGLVRKLVESGFDVFLDLKFHDIPNTVARACAAAAELGVWMLNVHTLGGAKMLVAAREALDSFGAQRPLLVGVTILTSLGDNDLTEIGLSSNVSESVDRLAGLANKAGLDGVVCSPQEVLSLRTNYGPDFLLVTPGVRPKGGSFDDQQRVATAANAINAGSDYLVIGRPITQADDPVSVLLTINSEISQLTN